MASFESVAKMPAGYTVLLVSLLLFFGQVLASASAFSRKQSAVFRALCVMQLLVGTVLFSFLLDGVFRVEYLAYPRGYFPVVRFVCGLPWAVILAVDLVLFCCVLGSILYSVNYGNRHISPYAVKEALDFLPAGICFSDENGAVILSNLKMWEWCAALTRGGLHNADAFWKTLQEEGEQRNGQVQIGCGGRKLQFSRAPITVAGKTYYQMLAFDVTQQALVTEELKKNNAKLRDIRTRIKQYSSGMSSLIMDREVLNARAHVHDEIGQTLLATRYYLDHPERTDEEQLLLALKYTNTVLLREAGLKDLKTDPYAEAVRTASFMGVKVKISGALPNEGPLRTIIGKAIGECASNAFKHAAGNQLTVSIAETENGLRVSLVTNGTLPCAPITESGGLKYLRKLVEAQGGAMCVRVSDGFCVELSLPQPENV